MFITENCLLREEYVNWSQKEGYATQYNCTRQKVIFMWFAYCSQKASMAELKTQLDEERDQRREEREKAAADLKASIQRIQSEAEEEIKRVSDVASRREREQQEVISKLQVAGN